MSAPDDTSIKDLICKTGTTFELHFTYKVNDVLQDTTNYRGKVQIRPYRGSPVVLYEANIMNAHLHFSGADGGVHWIIPPDVTDVFIFDKGVYDFILKLAPGIHRRPLEGEFLVDRSATTGTIP